MIDSAYLHIYAISFVAMFGGALIGIFTARALPNHHLSNESATVVKLTAAVVASLTSLVLALMLSSANSSFSVNAGIVKKLGSDLIPTDRTHDSSAHRRLVMDAILCGVASRSVQALQQASTMAS